MLGFTLIRKSKLDKINNNINYLNLYLKRYKNKISQLEIERDEIKTLYDSLKLSLNKGYLKYNDEEISSGLNRVRWAEGLIKQLPDNHEGRNMWLIKYGSSSQE